MGTALAHLFESLNKIDAANYLTGERNYDIWCIVGLSWH
jgi:hypothetical protein